MSRIGKLPVVIPSGIQIELKGRRILVTGPKGALNQELPQRVEIIHEGDKVLVHPTGNDRTSRAMHGLTRTLIQNMVKGVNDGFSKTLEIVGVGYRVEKKKDYLVFSLGYSHPILYEVPPGLEVKVESPTRLMIAGTDRQAVGQAAAVIRSFRPPEPYKGKGVKYSGEVIRRKEGKSGAR